MTIQIEQAKAMFPNVPDEVFNMFLVPLIDETTWHFSSVFDSTDGTRWVLWLAELSLHEFQQLRWNRQSLFVNPNILHPNSNADINILIMDHVFNIETILRREVPDSRDRFLWHVQSITNTGNICAPIVAIRAAGKIRILDGNHRLAAFFALNLQYTLPVEIWIGE